MQTKHGGVPGDYFMIGDNHAADVFVTKLSSDGRSILRPSTHWARPGWPAEGSANLTRKRQGLMTVVDIGAPLPSLFASTDGQAALVNADGTVNSNSNPARRGSEVAVWGTGITDGTQVWVGGKSAQATYADQAPGMVRGVQQVNFRVPTVRLASSLCSFPPERCSPQPTGRGLPRGKVNLY